MIPNTPVSPLCKSGHFSLAWLNDNQDDVFFEADTISYFPRVESDFSPLNQTTVYHIEREAHSSRLQVVPELDLKRVEAASEDIAPHNSFSNPEFFFFVTSPKEKVSQLSDCMFSRKLKSPNSNVQMLSLSETTTRKLSESEIELLKLLSPSLVGKSPKFSFGNCRENRGSSEDLSVYLPENFTPAPVEKLESSLEDTIFKFPEVPKIETETQEMRPKTTPSELDDQCEDMVTETSFFEEVTENARKSQKRKVSSVGRSASPTRRKRSKALQKQTERLRQTCSYLDESELRNKMERDRRTELNSKFNSLRDSIPELNSNVKASKVSILERAANYCVELRETDNILLQEKLTLKEENEKLWNRLLKLSSEQY